ncbi:MAG: DUF5985 family protein [Acidimicrobiales bacterium]
MRTLLSGLLAGLFLVSALAFRKFARRTGDRFFALFSAAFLILAVNSVALGLTDPNAEKRVGLYAVRLLAFTIILIGIYDKNRR